MKSRVCVIALSVFALCGCAATPVQVTCVLPPPPAPLMEPAPPPGSRGLRDFEIVLSGDEAIRETLAGLEAAGVEVGDEDGRAVVADPSGNRATLVV